jgi:hypothetical protein
MDDEQADDLADDTADATTHDAADDRPNWQGWDDDDWGFAEPRGFFG